MPASIITTHSPVGRRAQPRCDGPGYICLDFRRTLLWRGRYYKRMSTALALGVWLVLWAGGSAPPEPTSWETLENGLEFATFVTPGPDASNSKSATVVHALRIDPDLFEFKLLTASEHGASATVARWCRDHDLVAGINAGMYQEDGQTAVSLLRTRDHVNNSRLTKQNSVFAFDSNREDLPQATILDLSCDDFEDLKHDYAGFVQSIRMVSCEGKNVWKPQENRWSTAALGLNKSGDILIIHSPTRLRTHDLIDRLRELPLDLERCMYLEGGPQAQLYIKSGDEQREITGKTNSGFSLRSLFGGWPVPNVLGIARKTPSSP